MTTTNKLLKLQNSDLSASDLLELWSQKYGGNAGLSLAVLTDYLAANLSFPTTKAAQYEAPVATGFSVTVNNANTWLILTPLAGYAAGTIIMPNATQGDEVLVTCTQAVTALTVTPASGDSAVGQPTGLTANQAFTMKYDSVVKRWYAAG